MLIYTYAQRVPLRGYGLTSHTLKRMKHAELSMENIALQPHILIIEDEPGPRDALKMILRPFFRLHTAESAEGALQILRAHPIES